MSSWALRYVLLGVTLFVGCHAETFIQTLVIYASARSPPLDIPLESSLEGKTQKGDGAEDPPPEATPPHPGEDIRIAPEGRGNPTPIPPPLLKQPVAEFRTPT